MEFLPKIFSSDFAVEREAIFLSAGERERKVRRKKVAAEIPSLWPSPVYIYFQLYNGENMENGLSEKVIEAAVEVHRNLGGPGLLEGIYEAALCHELFLRGLHCQRQLPIKVVYKGVTVREPLYLDILVENQMVIEVKATEKDFPFYQAQLMTHLRMTGIPHGLLVNFGKKDLKSGVCRVGLDGL